MLTQLIQNTDTKYLTLSEILINLFLRFLTGFELQGKCASKGIRIPVIGIYAFDDANTRERARALRATAFFRKPVDGQALIDATHWAMEIAEDRPDASDS